MKYLKYLNESAVSKALELPEPKVGDDYPSEKVKRYIKIIDAALTEMSKKEENDANDAIVQDLRDKKKKWKNVDKETKPVKVKKDEPPEEQPEEQPPAEEEPPAPEQQQESKLKKYFIEGKPKFRKTGRANKIAKELKFWPDWYYTDVSRNKLINDIMKKFKLTKKKADDIINTWGKYKEQKMTTGELEDFIHMYINEDYKTKKHFDQLLKDFKAGKISKEEMLKKMKGK